MVFGNRYSVIGGLTQGSGSAPLITDHRLPITDYRIQMISPPALVGVVGWQARRITNKHTCPEVLLVSPPSSSANTNKGEKQLTSSAAIGVSIDQLVQIDGNTNKGGFPGNKWV
jgi:hypothetical protein